MGVLGWGLLGKEKQILIPPLLTCAVITTMRTTRSTHNNKHKRIFLPVPFPVPFLTCAGYNNAYCTVQRAACTVQVTTMRTRRRRLHNNQHKRIFLPVTFTRYQYRLPVPFQQCIQLQQCLQRIVSLLRTPYCTQKLLWKLLIKGITVTKLKM